MSTTSTTLQSIEVRGYFCSCAHFGIQANQFKAPNCLVSQLVWFRQIPQIYQVLSEYSSYAPLNTLQLIFRGSSIVLIDPLWKNSCLSFSGAKFWEKRQLRSPRSIESAGSEPPQSHQVLHRLRPRLKGIWNHPRCQCAHATPRWSWCKTLKGCWSQASAFLHGSKLFKTFSLSVWPTVNLPSVNWIQPRWHVDLWKVFALWLGAPECKQLKHLYTCVQRKVATDL